MPPQARGAIHGITMRTAALAAVLAAVLSGCASESSSDPSGGGRKSKIATQKDLDLAKKRLLQCLQEFEGRNIDSMDEAATELEEMEQYEEHLVSDEIAEQLKRYRSPATEQSAIDRLRWISKFARTMLLLEGYDKEKWERCRDLCVRQGPEAVVRFTGVLIVKFGENPDWCGRMLMDLCVAQGDLVQGAIFEALAFRGEKQPGALQMRILDDVTLRGLCAVLLGVPQPPVAKIRDSAMRDPETTRRAWAAKLHELHAPKSAATEPWATEVLAVQLAMDPEWEVRATAADSLGMAGDPDRAIPPLTKALKDKDHFVRKNCCVSLGRYGGRARRSVGPLLEMLQGLKSELWDVSIEGRIERRPLGGQPKAELDAAAFAALELMTGKTYKEYLSYFAWWDGLSPEERLRFYPEK